MNDNLQNALVEIINKAISSIDTSVEFMQTELPDVINQLLTWYAFYYGLLAFISVLIITVIIIGWVKLIKISKQREVDIDFFCLAIMSSLFLLILAALLFNLEWLQILMAPKIWLIEYGAILVK
jgi:hypothetical protein